MSWEEMSRRRYPCPCGRGEYEEMSLSDDWGRSETRREMFCMECKQNYVYDTTVIHGHPGDEIERGWVLKSVLEAEAKHRKDVEEKAKTLYLYVWKEKFERAKTKKQIWKVLTGDGKYYPSLGTFYKHTKEYPKEQLMRYVNGFFSYHGLKRVFAVCQVKPDLNGLGITQEELDNLGW